MSQIDDELKRHIVKRANETHVVPEKIGLEIDDAPEFEYLEPSTRLYEIAGAFDGVDDFHVVVTGIYEITVADWIVEYYEALTVMNSECGNPPDSWVVTVTEYMKDDSDGTWFTAMSAGFEPIYEREMGE